MLKFIKHHMETIVGIEFYPVLSFIIFFAFFTLCFIWVVRADKNKMEEISRLPLDNDND